MSRLIKSGWSKVEEQENKVISIRSFKVENEEVDVDAADIEISMQQKEILNEAKEEANRIVAEARAFQEQVQAQLQEERNNWDEEVVRLTNQAQESGYEAGFLQGKEEGYQQMHELIEQARETVNLSKTDYHRTIEESEPIILAIALKVAERILGQHLEGQSDHFLSIVKRALKEAREYREIQLHVHPAHYELLLSQKEDLIKIFPKETELYIYPDGDLTELSCIIESANGRIDASVDQQLLEIKAKLFELLESE
ncbi:putative flagellar assembly protein FliH [Robertmurraya siralis]|uniref:Flagellar assembly protein FliH n=1 Tax=Robertmurraya siralis TaxID=77777 RepID=A0A919WGK2_9BACI|nr:putative flagellar assembly protein FliH [Robertmurraya siralis]